MTTEYFSATGAPSTGATGSSATQRGEFTLIEAGFAKLPTLAGNGSLPVFVNAGATALEATAVSTARSRLGLAIGSNVQAWDADLDALAALAATGGMLARTGAGAFAVRTIAGTANEITVTNGDGVAGAPTLSLPTALTFTGKTVTGGTFSSITLTSPTITSPTVTNPANTTQALTDAAPTTWDVSLGAIATWTMGASRTISAPTNLKTGGRYVLVITQDATGGRAVTWNAVFIGVAGGSMPQPNKGASVVTVFAFDCPDGTNLRLVSNSVRSFILAKSGAAVSAPADTSEDTLATITVPANALGANGFIKYLANFTYTSNANAKTLRVRIGGSIVASFNVGGIGGSLLSGSIGNANATNAQISNAINMHDNSSSFAVQNNATAAIDTTASTTITLTVQKGTAGDTMTLNNYLFEICADGT